MPTKFEKLSKFGQEVRKLRLLNSIGQRELAAKIGCAGSKIHTIEMGKSGMTLEQLDLLIKVLKPTPKIKRKLRLLVRISVPRAKKGRRNEFLKIYSQFRFASDTDMSKISSILAKYK